MPEADYQKELVNKLSDKAISQVKRQMDTIIANQNAYSEKNMNKIVNDSEKKINKTAQEFEYHFNKEVPRDLATWMRNKVVGAIYTIPDLQKLVSTLQDLDKKINADLIAYKKWKVEIARNPFYYFWISLGLVVMLVISLTIWNWVHQPKQADLNEQALSKSYWNGVYLTYKTSTSVPNGTIKLSPLLQEGLQERRYIK